VLVSPTVLVAPPSDAEHVDDDGGKTASRGVRHNLPDCGTEDTGNGAIGYCGGVHMAETMICR